MHVLDDLAGMDAIKKVILIRPSAIQIEGRDLDLFFTRPCGLEWVPFNTMEFRGNFFQVIKKAAPVSATDIQQPFWICRGDGSASPVIRGIAAAHKIFANHPLEYFFHPFNSGMFPRMNPEHP